MKLPDPPTTFEFVFIKHGQSEWNDKMIFTGWYDSPLTAKGRDQARRAGNVLKSRNYQFDIVFTSLLTRAKETVDVILKELNQTEIPVVATWRLNERHDGFLTGQSILETLTKFGEIQCTKWARGYYNNLPPMEPDHPYYVSIITNPIYDESKHEPTFKFPQSESIFEAVNRVSVIWCNQILPLLCQGKRILICAHKHSLRSCLQFLENLSGEEIEKIIFPSCIPMVYTLNKVTIRPDPPGSTFQFLGHPHDVAKLTAEMQNQRRIPHSFPY